MMAGPQARGFMQDPAGSPAGDATREAADEIAYRSRCITGDRPHDELERARQELFRGQEQLRVMRTDLIEQQWRIIQLLTDMLVKLKRD